MQDLFHMTRDLLVHFSSVDRRVRRGTLTEERQAKELPGVSARWPAQADFGHIVRYSSSALRRPHRCPMETKGRTMKS